MESLIYVGKLKVPGLVRNELSLETYFQHQQFTFRAFCSCFSFCCFQFSFSVLCRLLPQVYTRNVKLILHGGPHTAHADLMFCHGTEIWIQTKSITLI